MVDYLRDYLQAFFWGLNLNTFLRNQDYLPLVWNFKVYLKHTLVCDVSKVEEKSDLIDNANMNTSLDEKWWFSKSLSYYCYTWYNY